jgi:hypothetical protein
MMTSSDELKGIVLGLVTSVSDNLGLVDRIVYVRFHNCKRNRKADIGGYRIVNFPLAWGHIIAKINVHYD